MLTRLAFVTILIIGFAGTAFFIFGPASHAVEGTLDTRSKTIMSNKPDGYPTAIFAGGCFWCLESEFRALDGVLFTRAGYIGGDLQNPDYRAVTTGETGHAEAVEITFDPSKISYEDLLVFFFTKAHDPTQLNRQGVDVGTQYRSAVFYLDETQKETAQNVIERVNNQKIYSSPIVTQLIPAETFWTAEEYHQQYYEKYEEQNGEIHPRVFFKKKLKALKN